MSLQLFKIETVEVASPVATITFSNIPQTYTDLKLVMSSRTDSTSVYGIGYIKPNGATTNLSDKVIEGTGSSAGSYTETSWRFEPNGGAATANIFGSAEVYIPNYTSANYKSASADTVTENNGAAVDSFLKAYLWSSTAAITSIEVATYSGQNFTAGSTFTLYGVL